MTYYSEAYRSPQTFRVRGQKLPARVKAGIILWLRIIHEQVLTADGLIGLRGRKQWLVLIEPLRQRRKNI